jgi:hypothetical protein
VRLPPSAFLLLPPLVLGATVAHAQALPDHAAFDRVLQAVVRGGLVDYAALKATRTGLDRYLDELGRTNPSALAAADRDERLAFWVNAFNACVLRLVIDHYPLAETPGRDGTAGSTGSIRGIKDAWARSFCRVAQQERSLDGIEQSIIRPLDEPRTHFVLHRAARSGPALGTEAYHAEQFDRQLDDAVRRFVADTAQYRLVRGARTVLRVNRLLDWYKSDFGGTSGVVAFLRRYASPEDVPLLEPGQLRVEYAAFDWHLNDLAEAGPGR